MDQRREPRFATNQPIVVTVLGEHPRTENATIRNASGRGLAIALSGTIVPGSAVKIELEDSIVLGEAVYCGEEPGCHVVGVQLDQVLFGLAELGKKLQEFADATPVEPRR